MIPQSNSWSLEDWEKYLKELEEAYENWEGITVSSAMEDLRAMLNDWKKEHKEYEDRMQEISYAKLLADMAHNGD